jgi:hypothetical protein
LQARASRRDQQGQAAQEWIDSENSFDANDEDLVPSAGQTAPEPERKPRQMRRRYVNRNGVWLRARRITPAHRNPGEVVYVRDAPGRFTNIGTVGEGGKLPTVYVGVELKFGW